MPGGASDHFLTVRILGVIDNLGDTHMETLLMGVASFAIMIGLKRFAPKIPAVLVAVVTTTVVSYSIGFEKMGGKVVGTIPEGLPGFAMPAFNLEAFSHLFIRRGSAGHGQCRGGQACCFQKVAPFEILYTHGTYPPY